MKFILQENTSFILEERCKLAEADSLTEASISEVAQKWTAQLTDTFSNTAEVLKKYHEFSGNPLSSAKVQNLKTSLDRGLVLKYKTLKQALIELQKNF